MQRRPLPLVAALLGSTLIACTGGVVCEPGTSEVDGVCVDDVVPDPEPDPDPKIETMAQLEAFYADNGGKDAFPPTTVDALETLLLAQDEVAVGDYAAAKSRVDAIFAARGYGTPIWRENAGYGGLNVGDPVAYYGLRMLEPIIAAGDLPQTGTFQMTVVVATCASVTRPTLPNLERETVDLTLDPEILADDAKVLRVSTNLFRRWVKAVTGGQAVELVVHEMTGCATVDYTDDGSVIVSYPDATQMIESVPDSIAGRTDFWWVVAPSGVPGDGSGYDRHFITGGMGGYGSGQPLFLSDDGWFVRKPEHLGSGRYSEIERRAYQPQWFQHEFMHHLFRTWPEFGLEDEGHQWFNLDTWPDDFEGRYEADYYSEAINKRLSTATPSLADGLTAPEIADMSTTPLADIAGDYEVNPVQNDWHRVSVTVAGDTATWSNAAGVQWSMSVVNGSLFSGSDCPYGVQEVPVELGSDGKVIALWFQGGRYGR
ncbi:MAG: hypothetical protein AB8H79_08525 [Myxococcota bacterium]